MAYGDLDYIQQTIHRKYEQNTDYPESDSDDYTLRTGFVQDWIKNWENEEGVLWNELWVEGTKASVADATSYDLSSSHSNMKRPGGWVRVWDQNGGSLYFPVVTLEQVQLNDNKGHRFCYFTGNDVSGYTLNFNPNAVITDSASTIHFPYYKKATIPDEGSEKVEMSDFMYIVHGVLSDLYSSEDPSESDKQFQLAQSRLRAMKTRNLQVPWWQENSVPDRAYVSGGRGFGR